MKTEVISGDRNLLDQTLGTFNPLFPRGGYFGLAARFGPRNLIDVHPSLTLTMSPSVMMTIDYDIFWRHTREDGIYTVPGELIYPGETNTSRFIGEQLSIDWVFSPHLFLDCALEFKWFNSGAFLKQAGTGRDIFYGMVKVQLKF